MGTAIVIVPLVRLSFLGSVPEDLIPLGLSFGRVHLVDLARVKEHRHSRGELREFVEVVRDSEEGRVVDHPDADRVGEGEVEDVSGSEAVPERGEGGDTVFLELGYEGVEDLVGDFLPVGADETHQVKLLKTYRKRARDSVRDFPPLPPSTSPYFPLPIARLTLGSPFLASVR